MEHRFYKIRKFGTKQLIFWFSAVCLFFLVNLLAVSPVFAHVQCEEGVSSGPVRCETNSFLAQGFGRYTLPLIMGAGLVDGINPCAIGLIILLLGYLIIFAKKSKEVFKIGTVYILAVFLTYLAIGLVFYKFITGLISSSAYHDMAQVIRYFLGGLIIVAGIVNVKDYFWYGKGFSLQISESRRWKLTRLVKKASVPAAASLGALVTFFELPCSLPLYIGSINLLYLNLNTLRALGYLVIYNLMFVLPLIFILILILSGKRIVELKEWQESGQRLMKLGMGIALLLLGTLLFLV